MSDQFMNHLRKDPRPEFGRELRDRLRREEVAEESRPRPWLVRHSRLTVSFAAAAAVVLALVFSPGLRVSAQAFLDLFRVRNFAAVAVDPQRLEKLRDLNTAAGKNPSLLIFDDTKMIHEPGTPRIFFDAQSAGRAAGLQVLVPGSLPYGLVSDTVRVEGAGEAELTFNATKMRNLLQTLGLTDVQVPAGLDGAHITVRMPTTVIIPFQNDQREVVLVQAHSPEVTAPPGVDLERVGEMALRVIGLPADEARRFARSVDWRTTVIVPVPMNSSAFREVDVRGRRGLLVTTDGAPAGTEIHGRRGAVLMWTEGDMVYGLSGNTRSEDLLIIANSLH